MNVFNPTLLRRSAVVGMLAAAIGLALAFSGLGLAGFFVAAVVTSPAVFWIQRGDVRSGSRTGA